MSNHGSQMGDDQAEEGDRHAKRGNSQLIKSRRTSAAAADSTTVRLHKSVNRRPSSAAADRERLPEDILRARAPAAPAPRRGDDEQQEPHRRRIRKVFEKNNGVMGEAQRDEPSKKKGIILAKKPRPRISLEIAVGAGATYLADMERSGEVLTAPTPPCPVVVSAGPHGDLHELILGRGFLGEEDDALLLEGPLRRAARAHHAVVLLEHLADLGDGAVGLRGRRASSSSPRKPRPRISSWRSPSAPAPLFKVGAVSLPSSSMSV